MMEIDISKLLRKKRLSQLFARLLKEKRCYMSYIRAMKKHGHGIPYSPFLQYGFSGNFLEKVKLAYSPFTVDKKLKSSSFFADIIDKSFFWDETENGADFWGDIYSQFRDSPQLTDKISYETFSTFKNS